MRRGNTLSCVSFFYKFARNSAKMQMQKCRERNYMGDVLETGANEQPVAEVAETPSVETVAEGSEKTPEVAEPAQSAEVNAQFAEARRRAEAEYKAKIDSERSRINGEVKRLFGNSVNPVTGTPINTFDEYIQAVEMQRRNAQEAMLKERGIDPSVIQDMVNNSPAMIQAQKILAQNTEAEAQRLIEEDMKIINTINPDLKTVEDLANHESYDAIIAYVQKGIALADAYKLANYDSIAKRNTEAAKQAAINSAKSQSHLTATNSLSVGNDGEEDIPATELKRWKDMFPDASAKELKAKYNRAKKARN